MDVDKVASLEAYKQAFETYRHYANLRFAALTAFIAITGALFVLALRKPAEDEVAANKDRTRFWFLCGAGLFISINFLLCDLRLDQLMTFFVENTFRLASALNMDSIASEHPPKTWIARISYPEMSETVYFGAVAAWIVAVLLKLRKKL